MGTGSFSFSVTVLVDRKMARIFSMFHAGYSQEQHGQVLGVLHPDAAMAEGPVGFAEKLPLRGIVQIDVILVGEVELHPAQRIMRPRFLNDLQGVAGFQAKMVAAQVAVILLDFTKSLCPGLWLLLS